MRNILDSIIHILREENDFLVTAHVNPDGDAIGSMASLAWMLHRLGKRVVAYNESGVPGYLDWVDFPCPVYSSPDDLPFTPRRLVVLDCGSPSRAGEAMERLASAMPSICIDHHIGTPDFAEVNWIAPDFAAVGEMLAVLANRMDLPLDGPLGEALYLALVSDTGHFAYGNTTPRTMEIAAEILRRGLNPEVFAQKSETNWTLRRVHLWGTLFTSVKLAHEGKVAYMLFPEKLFTETETTIEDTEGIVNTLRNIRGVEIALTIRDAAPGQCKISMRSRGTVDVRAVAVEFGGGGHRNAAGATLTMPLDAACDAVLETIGRKLALDGKQA